MPNIVLNTITTLDSGDFYAQLQSASGDGEAIIALLMDYYSGGRLLWFAATLPILLLVMAIQAGAFSALALEGMQERDANFRELLRIATRRAPALSLYIVVSFLVTIPFFLPTLALAVATSASVAAGNVGLTVAFTLLAILFFFLGIAGAAVATVGICLAPSAILHGKHSAFDALVRAWALSKGHRLTLFLVYLVIVLVYFVVFCCVLSPFGTATSAVGLAGEPVATLARLVNVVVYASFATSYAALVSMTTAVAYGRIVNLRPAIDGDSAASVFS